MTQANFIFLLFLDLALTVGISFLCSILEAVLMSTPLSYIIMREEEGYKPASLFKKYKTDIDRPIAAILAMNTIANTFGASLVGVLTTKAFGSAWVGWMGALTTLLILVCSEIIPKTIGTSKYRSLMGFTTSGISFLLVIMYPLVILIRYISERFSGDEDDTAISREEVSAMANVGEEEGVIDRSENKVIQNIIKLDNVNMRMGDYGFCYLLRPVLFNNIVTVHPRHIVTRSATHALVPRPSDALALIIKDLDQLPVAIAP